MTEKGKIQSQKRNQYQKDKKSGNLGNKRMAFFREILQALNLNYARLSKLSGVSCQAIQWWMVADDVIYSKIVDVFKKSGYSLKAKFVINKDTAINNKYIIKIKNIPSNKILQQIINENKHCSVIAKLIMNTNKTSLTQFCEQYNISYDILTRVLRTDRFKVSFLEEIAEKTGSKIEWELKQISRPSDNSEENN